MNAEHLRPKKAEQLFLSLGYNRFYDLFEEVMRDSFWQLDAWQRFSKVFNGFSVYNELLNYEPFKYIFKAMKSQRPPMEAEIGSELFKFVRNILAHFPLFETWNDVWISKSLINWNREGQSIDRFLKKYQGNDVIKYRIWEESKKKMTYLSIAFPNEYSDRKIFLKEILEEKDGVKFSFIMMRNILNTQVEEISENE